MVTKIVIVGGVAAGASAAAKARRIDEQAEITLVERGPYVSFANCGLPYYISGDIKERASLFLQSPEGFRKRFNVDARVLHEATRIDREGKRLEVKDVQSGALAWIPYDKLILAPGAGAIVPDVPGIRARNIFVVKTVPDSDAVRSFLDTRQCRRAVVIGAGFIGLEAAEALRHRGLAVTLIEKLPQVLPPFDPDMASFVSEHLAGEGVELHLSDGIKEFHGGELATEVECESGRKVPFDLAILSIGVRPELRLAREAGLRIGNSGGIEVDAHQRTSDPDIYAAGDAVEILHGVTKARARIPLAGPANKQGRVAGANAAGGDLTFAGSLGTAIVETLGITAAKTGLSRRDATQAGFDAYESFTHSPDHAGYYPGSSLMHIKLVAERKTGRLLGAQIVGEKGVDKRIDVLATALSAGMSVTDLENLDLAYAPQFSSAKDPVNMAGFVASNVVRGEFRALTCGELRERLDRAEALQVVDVRTREEYEGGHLDQAHLIPVDELRERCHELDPRAKTVVYCKIGLRGYLAAKILQQNGFTEVYNLTGGLLACPGKRTSAPPPATAGVRNGSVRVEQFREELRRGLATVIDVRESDEYSYEHIEGTVSCPESRLETLLDRLPRDRDVYVTCATGVRSAHAVRRLQANGFLRVHDVEGGLAAWKKAGLPVVRRRGPIPIMRQVQIVAGSLALIGGVVPELRWIAAFIGAGLVFAGISGFCGMAKVLAWMPWNRPGGKSSGSSTCSAGCS
jgi:NADPH-dependent 2,4-dienoyl-CoA reductase/sulfur reductase-like enzyme/rhodanese-related sulfurtransferase